MTPPLCTLLTEPPFFKFATFSISSSFMAGAWQDDEAHFSGGSLTSCYVKSIYRKYYGAAWKPGKGESVHHACHGEALELTLSYLGLNASEVIFFFLLSISQRASYSKNKLQLLHDFRDFWRFLRFNSLERTFF